jgi:hypothetical protein
MKLIRGGVVVALAMSLLGRAHAAVLPNDAVLSGKTIGEWSAEWLKWMVAIPTNQNPMLDLDGSSAGVRQPEGDVFFLGFVSGLTHGTVTRRFSVPEGKYLFFPVMFYEADNVGTDPALSVEKLRDQAAGIVDDPIELHATIDGVEVPNLLEHRAISPVLSIFYDSPDNFHSFAFGYPITGLIDPAIADGYWLMVEPLPPGVHTLHFGGRLRNYPFIPADIIDHLTVVPSALPEQVSALIQRVTSSASPTKHRQSLLATLEAAKGSFQATNWFPGVNQLHAFQNKVRAQVRPGDPALAEELSTSAQRIIDRAALESK